MDGGALRLNALDSHSLQITVHPDLAYSLNKLLSQSYPDMNIINKKKTAIEPLMITLPPSTINLISEGMHFDPKHKTIHLHSHTQGQVVQSARHIIEGVGGTYNGHCYQFDYDPTETFKRISISGVLPVPALP